MILLLMFMSAAQAGPIYKSVDENGRVTYSSTLPENSKEFTKVEILPAPSQDRIEDAQQGHERNVRAAELLDENRKKRNEILAEENRRKLEKQKQLQKKTEQKESEDHNVYPYYLPRYPGIYPPPYKPGYDRPVHDHPRRGLPQSDHPIKNRPPAGYPEQLPIQQR
jgi:hypothetical protein